MIARTVTPGDSTGGIAKTGEARAHRQTRRGGPAHTRTPGDGEAC
jgi:hypothetical protein